MADLKMNQFSETTSVSKVVGIDSDNSSRLISPNNLIQTGIEIKGATDNDLNNALKTGLYVANFETKNNAINDYGVVEVTRISAYIIQKHFALNQNRVFIRRSINSGSTFTQWVSIL